MASDRHSIRARRGSVTTLYGADKDVADWVSYKLFGIAGYFGNAKAMGIMADGQIICGIVYNNYLKDIYGQPLSMEVSIASVDKRWANRHTLREAFAYPFIQLGLERVQATTSTKNEGANLMLQRLGFQQEGTHRKAYATRDDAYSWSMLKSDCKWLEVKNG